MNKKWTDEQIEAIRRTEENIIVAASAGSGKTTTMVERAIRLVLQGTPVTRITMLTFTEAAAAEMKDRLRARLIEAVKEATMRETRDYLVRQIDELPYASISTMHSFCAGLVREFFEQIPLSPNVRILEPTVCDDLKQKAFEQLLKEKETDAAFADMRMTIGLRNDDELYGLVGNLYEYMTNQPDRERWIREMYRTAYGVPFEDTTVAKSFVRSLRTGAQSARDICRQVLAVIEPTDKGYAGVLKLHERSLLFADVVTVKDAYLAYERYLQNKGAIRAADSQFFDQITLAKEILSADTIKYFESVYALGGYDEIVSMHANAAPFIEMLCDAVLQFQRIFGDLKAELGGVDFADLERYALNVLADESIAQEIRERSDYVFVDEYQDTNYVQNALIERIAPPDRLFVVGDSKQCIFRFREAEPQIFLDALERLGAERRAITFGKNFRSDTAILRFVNKVFDSLMTRDFGGVDYRRTDRFDLVGGHDGGEKVVSIYAYDKPKRGEKPMAKGVYSVKDAAFAEDEEQDQEALAIAEYIQMHLGEEVVVKGQSKRLDYGDFAILFATRSAGNGILRTLLGLGLPLNLDSFYSNVGLHDVNVLLAYADVMDNYMQDYPLLTVLRSPLGGFSDAELAEIRLSGDRYLPYWQVFKAYGQGQGELAERAASFWRSLGHNAFAASFTPLGSLFKQILLTSGYTDYLFTQEDGVARLAALHGFIADFAGKPYGEDLHTLCTHYRAYPVTKLQTVSVGATTRRIVVSTMHSAKGLEYPVVILPALHAKSGSGGDKTKLSLDKHLGVATDYYDKTDRSRHGTFAQKVIDATINANESEDRLRLLYVAMTRAQCYMLLSFAKMSKVSVLPKTTKNFANWLQYAMWRDKGLERHLWSPTFRAVRPTELRAEPLELDGNLQNVLAYRYPYEAAVYVGKKYTVTALNARYRDDEAQLASFLDWHEEAGLGTLYHTVFQHVDYHATTPHEVAEECARLVREGYLSEEEQAMIDPSVVAECLALPLLQKAIAPTTTAMHEQRFVLAVNSSQIERGTDEQVLIQGVIDLMLVEPDKLTVIDFKLSKRTPDALAEAYRMQLSLYCQAVAQAMHRKVDECYLVEINRAMVIPMPLA